MHHPDKTKETHPSPPPYAGLGATLILRDVLAIDRTRLANERTLLAWLRTGLMLLVSGVTLVKLFEGQALAEVTGYVLMPAGLVAGVFGVYRYLRVKARIETSRND
jgi:putative membrane protein